jgi:hypothetical protein
MWWESKFLSIIQESQEEAASFILAIIGLFTFHFIDDWV